MKVSLVIPTYQCADLLRVTLESIRLSGWSDLEILIRDAASQDGTVEVAESFGDLPIRVVSEPDAGQYDAINKGFAEAQGDILAWINAGDFFLPGAVANVVEAFRSYPEIRWMCGLQCVAEGLQLQRIGEATLLVSDLEIRLGLCKGGPWGHLQQEGMFWRRDLWEEAGPLNLDYSLAADYELWTRYARVTRLYRLAVPLAAFSYHGSNRSVNGRQRYDEEVRQAIERLPDGDRPLHHALVWLPLFWRTCRRLPLLREGLALVCGLVRHPSIRVVFFEGQGESFRARCEAKPAWTGGLGPGFSSGLKRCLAKANLAS